jgi:ankyrin repeat protein
LEPDGSTALHAAAFFGHIDIVRRLVEHGAIVRTLKNKYNLTPAEETTHENIRKLLEPGVTDPPRKRFINDDYNENSSNQQTIRNPSGLLFSRALLAYVKAKKGITNMDDEERREWVVTYDNNCIVLDYISREHMRKWLTKLPLSSILEAINNDYVNNPGIELTDKDRETIRNYVEAAISDEDPGYLVYAYTLQTNFYIQLNRDLADKGLFESVPSFSKVLFFIAFRFGFSK